MATEKDFETALAKYPELIEEGLELIGRQIAKYGRRMDLVFTDRFRRTLITELKWGPITDTHVGQIMAYEGILLSSSDPCIRVMLIGTRVPPNLRKSLDHHGIAWKEITLVHLVNFLSSKCDADLLRVFEEEASPPGAPPSRNAVHAHREDANRRTGRGAGDEDHAAAKSLEHALSICENPHAQHFFERALERKQARVTNALRYNDSTGRLRWYVRPQIQEAYVVQKGRFLGDEDFWRSRLSLTASLIPKRKTDGNADLRFHLAAAADFLAFQEVAEKEAIMCVLGWETSRRKGIAAA
jgi:hypothetical protein